MKRRDFLLNTTAILAGSMVMGGLPKVVLAQDTPVSGGTLI